LRNEIEGYLIMIGELRDQNTELTQRLIVSLIGWIVAIILIKLF